MAYMHTVDGKEAFLQHQPWLYSKTPHCLLAPLGFI